MKHNAPFAKIRCLPPLERFNAQHEKREGGCWIWIGYKDKDGYGKFSVDYKDIRAHRFSYELFVGPIASGLEIDHKCRVRACVNPNHLDAVTSRVNQERSPISFTTVNRAKKQCPRGHSYSEGNTMFEPNKYGFGRSCRICKLAWARRWYWAQRGVNMSVEHYVTRIEKERLEQVAA